MTSKEYQSQLAEKDEQIEELKKLQSGSDRKYQSTAIELKETKARLTELESNRSKQPDLIARLNKIEERYENKVEQLELTHHAELACRDRGIPTELLNGRSFDNELDVDDYLDVVSTALEAKRIEAVNESFSGLSTPRAGAGEAPTQAEQTKAALARYGLDADYINGNSS